MELKTARRIARLTQSALATDADVDASTISLIENKKRDYLTVAYGDIVRIARRLNVSADELFPVPDRRPTADDEHQSAAERHQAIERRQAERRAL